MITINLNLARNAKKLPILQQEKHRNLQVMNLTIQKLEPTQEKDHNKNYAISTISKSSFLAPHSGQTQSNGTSSHLVPGAMLSFGQPIASSYTYPHIRHMYFFIIIYPRYSNLYLCYGTKIFFQCNYKKFHGKARSPKF